MAVSTTFPSLETRAPVSIAPPYTVTLASDTVPRTFPPLTTTDWVETYIPVSQYTKTHALDLNDPMVTTRTFTESPTGTLEPGATATLTALIQVLYHTWLPVTYTQTFAPTGTLGGLDVSPSPGIGTIGMTVDGGSQTSWANGQDDAGMWVAVALWLFLLWVF